VGKLCISLAAVWSLLGVGTCALLFAVSLIPLQGASPNYVRSVPVGLDYTGTILGVCMVPLCMFIPVPLLIAGRRHLRRSLAGTRRVTAWTASASAGILVEALFLFKLGHHDSLIPYRSWHALELSVGFLAVGAAMAAVLLGIPPLATLKASRPGQQLGPN
jgi:hypothetical protein